jgi:arylsulfatase
MMNLRISAKTLTIILLGCIFLTSAATSDAIAKTERPNILVIFGDDIGMWNVGVYTHGMMGRTPNIDRIAKEGMLFTDHYAQPSCT